MGKKSMVELMEEFENMRVGRRAMKEIKLVDRVLDDLEMGNFIIMLHGGWSKKRVILANIFSSLLSTIGVLFVFIITASISGILLAMTAGFFIYICIADLLPEIYKHGARGKFTHMLVFFMVGFMLIALISVKLIGLPE